MEVSGRLKLHIAFEVLSKFPNLDVDEIKFRVGKEFLTLTHNPPKGWRLKYKVHEAFGETPIEAVENLKKIRSICDELSDVLFIEDEEENADTAPANTKPAQSSVVKGYRLR